jgi:hypothetical protein
VEQVLKEHAHHASQVPGLTQLALAEPLNGRIARESALLVEMLQMTPHQQHNAQHASQQPGLRLPQVALAQTLNHGWMPMDIAKNAVLLPVPLVQMNAKHAIMVLGLVQLALAETINSNLVMFALIVETALTIQMKRQNAQHVGQVFGQMVFATVQAGNGITLVFVKFALDLWVKPLMKQLAQPASQEVGKMTLAHV